VATPIVVSVNVGRPKPLAGKSGVSSIDKRGVDGPIAVQLLGLAGDTQSDTQSHGGVDQAIYAYATEDLAHWATILDRELTPGQFGENLSTRSVDVTGALIGETWRIGGTLLQVSRPRIPCVVFQNWLAEPHWVKRFTEEGRPGAYLRVLEPGELAANDDIVIEDRPDHDITIGMAFRALTTDRDLLPRLLVAHDLPEGLYAYVEHASEQLANEN
jgi:MOSC domain-containing protein YiiM